MADPMTMTREEIAAAEERCAKASRGPWRSMAAGNAPLANGRLVGQTRVDGLPRPYQRAWVGWERADDAHQFSTYLIQADGDFVAHARTDLPRALAGNRAYLDLVERIEALATHWEQATLARRQGYPAERARELRALLSQKEPTE